MLKRAMSLFLALFLALGMLPAPAFAQENEPAEPETTVTEPAETTGPSGETTQPEETAEASEETEPPAREPAAEPVAPPDMVVMEKIPTTSDARMLYWSLDAAVVELGETVTLSVIMGGEDYTLYCDVYKITGYDTRELVKEFTLGSETTCAITMDEPGSYLVDPYLVAANGEKDRYTDSFVQTRVFEVKGGVYFESVSFSADPLYAGEAFSVAPVTSGEGSITKMYYRLLRTDTLLENTYEGRQPQEYTLEEGDYSLTVYLTNDLGAVYARSVDFFVQTKSENGIAEGSWGEHYSWFLSNEGVLTLSGGGDIDYWSFTTPPWKPYSDQIKELVIESGIISLYPDAFENCFALTTVHIPDTLRYFNGYFRGCYALEKYIVDENNPYLTAGEDGVLYNKDRTQLFAWPASYAGVAVVPEGVQWLVGCAFGSCRKLTGFAWPTTLTALDLYENFDDTGITSLMIPKDVTSLHGFIRAREFVEYTVEEGNENYLASDGLLYGITVDRPGLYLYAVPYGKTGEVSLLEDTVSLGSFTFTGERGIRSVIFPAKLSEIYNDTFRGSSVKKVQFTGDAPSIEDEAFLGTTLTAYYPANNATWTEEVRQNYGGTITWVEAGDGDAVLEHFEASSSLINAGESIVLNMDISGSGPYTVTCRVRNTVTAEEVTTVTAEAQSQMEISFPTGGTYEGYVTLTNGQGEESRGEYPFAVTVADGLYLTGVELDPEEPVEGIPFTAGPVLDGEGEVTQVKYELINAVEGSPVGEPVTYDHLQSHSITLDPGTYVILVTLTNDQGISYKASRSFSVNQHKPVTDPAVAPTCTEPGKTEGSHCELCGAVITPQEEIPALGHDPEFVNGAEPTCTEPGHTEDEICSRCGDLLTPGREIPALGHTPAEITIPAAPAANEAPGNKEFTVTACSACGAWLNADGSEMTEEQIAALWAEYAVYVKAQSIALTLEGQAVAGTTLEIDLDAEPDQLSLFAKAQPAGAKPGIAWSTSSKTVATVEDGLVTFLKPGTVKITAKATDGSGKSASVAFKVIYKDPAAKLTGKQAEITNIYGQLSKSGLQVGDSVDILIYGTDKTQPLEGLTYEIISGGAFAELEGNTLTALTAAKTVKVKAYWEGDPLKRSYTVSVKTKAAIPGRLQIPKGTLADLDEYGYILSDGFLDTDDLPVLLAARSAADKTFAITLDVWDQIGQPMADDNGVTWTSSSTKIATVKENKDGTITVTVKKNASGEATITAKSKLDKTVVTTMTVRVVDYTPKLKPTSVTLNTFLTDPTAAIPLTWNEDDAVETVEFVDKDGVPYPGFTIAYDDERTAFVVKTSGETMKNATYSGKLKLTTRMGQELALTFSVKISNKAPTVTLKQTRKLNLLDENSFALYTITSKQGTVDKIVLSEDMQLIPTGGENQFRLDYADGIADILKTDVRGKAEIWVEGYKDPVIKSLSVGTEKVKNKAVLAKTTIELYTSLPGMEAQTDLTSYFVGLNVEDCTFATTSVQGKKVEVKCVDGKVTASFLNAADLPKAGTYSFAVIPTIEGTAVAKVTLRVKVTAVPKTTLSPTTAKVSLSKGMPASVTVKFPEARNAEFAGFLEIAEGAYFHKDQDVSDDILLSYENGVITVSLAEGCSLKPATYTIKLTPVYDGVEMAQITLKVTITK